MTPGRPVAPGGAARQIHPIATPDGRGEVTLEFDAEGYLLGVEILDTSRVPGMLDSAPWPGRR